MGEKMKREIFIIIIWCLLFLNLGFGFSVSSIIANIDQNIMQYEVETIVFKIPNRFNVHYLRDTNIGNGGVRGHFFVLNNDKKAYLNMIFYNIEIPGQAEFDLVCENISISVMNPFNETTYYCNIKGEGMLFSNRWIGSVLLLLPDYYDYSIIEITIFGNYE
jgi:hypothetical protein